MMNSINPIPEGYQQIIPYLITDDAKSLITFLQQAFDAKLITCHEYDHKIMNAELRLFNCIVMIADARDSTKPNTTMLYVYTENTDKTYQTAIAAGGISILQPCDQFYGDRNAGIKDPAGNQWWIATHKEDLSDSEMQSRVKQYRG